MSSVASTMASTDANGILIHNIFACHGGISQYMKTVEDLDL